MILLSTQNHISDSDESIQTKQGAVHFLYCLNCVYHQVNPVESLFSIGFFHVYSVVWIVLQCKMHRRLFLTLQLTH